MIVIMRNVLNPFARWQHHMCLSTDYIFGNKNVRNLEKKHYIAIVCSVFTETFQSYSQDGSTIFYEFLLNFVEILTKFADC